jgi:hypothetical protein
MHDKFMTYMHGKVHLYIYNGVHACITDEHIRSKLLSLKVHKCSNTHKIACRSIVEVIRNPKPTRHISINIITPKVIFPFFMARVYSHSNMQKLYATD